MAEPGELPSDGTPIDGIALNCPAVESDQLKSIHIDLGWTFSTGTPVGSYELTLNGQRFEGPLANGKIRIDNKLNSVAGSGELTITITNGPIFNAHVQLCMPEIQSAMGLAQRLTNLGFYAGTDGVCNGRMRWAIRAFKRARMNGFKRNKAEVEDNAVTVKFLTAVQNAYGSHPNDTITGPLTLTAVNPAPTPCFMFGSRDYRRGSFETAGAKDDKDPRKNGNKGIWLGANAAGSVEAIAGTFAVFLRAFDPGAGESPIPNRVNLPQPIHMAQFVLFELGYWLVAGPGPGGWTTRNGTKTRERFTPKGEFGRHMQWATREFQCHAKLPSAAVEDVSSDERYLVRLLGSPATPLAGFARYPKAGRISGALNNLTKHALQAWADGALRCPVIIYASTDIHNAGGVNGSDLTRIVKENLWFHDDHKGTGPRMFAIDYSGYYDLPAAYAGTVTTGGFTFPRPIVVGRYASEYDGGPISEPDRHTWQSPDTEVRPDTTIGAGGHDGVGLSASQLSTFKVVRTAAHFECYGYFDSLNAYDNVTISFGPCHWTLARCRDGDASKGREMPAFLAYMRSEYGAVYQAAFGIFGLAPEHTWPIAMGANATYIDRLTIETESGHHVLSGASGGNANRKNENKYGKSWHFFYRFQMAARTWSDMRRGAWDFTRIRIRDILDKTFTIAGAVRRVGDYVTSEKGVAMLLRWHIYAPAHLFPGPSHLRNVLATVIAAHPAANQARENAVLQQLNHVGGPLTHNSLTTLHGFVNVPQQGLRPYYQLDLAAPGLSDALNSFDFDPPPP